MLIKFIDKNANWHLIKEFSSRRIDESVYYEKKTVSAEEAAKINCFIITEEQWNALKQGYIVISE